MALFSRRKKTDPVPEAGIEQGEQPVSADAPTDAEVSGGDSASAASVGISVSSFRGLGGAPVSPSPSPGSAPTAPGAPAPAASAPEPASTQPAPPTASVPRRPGPAVAPAAHETVPGLRDNALLRHALAALPETPTAPDLINVARQLLQGHVFLRVQGDARALLSEGKPLPLAVATRGEKQYVLVYSGGAALQDAVKADGDLGTSAAGQPVLAVIRHVLAGPYEGLVIDNSSSPARAVLPRPVLQRAVDETTDALRLKTLLAAERTDGTATDVVAALAEGPMWVAVRRGDDGKVAGVAESRTPEGERYLEVFSHPLEALALARGDHPAPLTPAQLASALARDEALTGVIVDPAGPWIRLSRLELAPLLAAAQTP